MAEQLPFLVILPLLLGLLVVPAVGLVRSSLAHPLACLAVLAYAALAFAQLSEVLRSGVIRYSFGGWPPPQGIEFRVDALSAFVVAVVSAIALIVVVYSRLPVRRELPEKEMPFYGVLLILLLGLTGIVLTGDLFNLYVFFEVSSLSGYALMAIGSRKAVVSAYRYLIMGTMGASFYLLGVGYLYFLTGSLNMVDVAARVGELGANPAFVLSLVLMTAGVGLKMALFPMHLWLPDAYTYASSAATAIIAPVMTKVSAYVLIRMLFFVYGANLVSSSLPIADAITWLGLAGIVVGSVFAIAQKDAKRMLAHSSVAQVGFIAVGIGIGTPLALVAALLHVLNHAAMKCCLFLVTGNIAREIGSTRIDRISGMGANMPWTFFGFTVGALAMIGIPPTNGFFSKWYLVLGGIREERWTVVAIVIASGLLTSVYFFRLLVKIYTGTPHAARPREVREAPVSMCAPVVALAAGLVALGLANAWFVGDVLQATLPPGMELPK